MLDKIKSLNTPEKSFFCEECGRNAPLSYTTINRTGPYCADCWCEAEILEQDENSQFGVGA